MNFALILFLATVFCALMYALDLAVFARRRRAAATDELAAFDRMHAGDPGQASLTGGQSRKAALIEGAVAACWR